MSCSHDAIRDAFLEKLVLRCTACDASLGGHLTATDAVTVIAWMSNIKLSFAKTEYHCEHFELIPIWRSYNVAPYGA